MHLISIVTLVGNWSNNHNCTTMKPVLTWTPMTLECQPHLVLVWRKTQIIKIYSSYISEYLIEQLKHLWAEITSSLYIYTQSHHTFLLSKRIMTPSIVTRAEQWSNNDAKSNNNNTERGKSVARKRT